MKYLSHRIISIIAIFGIILSTNIPVGATINKQSYSAQIAHVTDINSTGNNMGNDYAPQDAVLNNSDFGVVQGTNNCLTLTGEIESEEIGITCIPIACSSDAQRIFFECSTDHSKWAVLESTYEYGNLNYLYFQKYSSEHPEYTSVLRFVLKDLTSVTQDYIFLEIFGVQLTNLDEIIQAVESNDRPPYWYVTEFTPTSEDTIDLTTRGTSNAVNKYTRTYDTYGLSYTHSLTVKSHIDAHDVLHLNDDTTVIYTLTVMDKDVYCNDTGSYTDYGYSELRISDLSLCVATMPGSAIFMTMSDGSVSSMPSSDIIEYSVGVSFGAISATINIGSIFQDYNNCDVNGKVDSFENNDPDSYVRSADIDLADGYYLYDIGDNVTYYIYIRDYGHEARPSSAFKGRWEIYLTNPIKSDFVLKTLSHNTYLSIE